MGSELKDEGAIVMKERIKSEINEFHLLMKSVPTVLVTLFIISVLSMNLLANKSLNLNISWLALDCGIIVSWFSFLVMDMITARFGPKAATEISLLAITINLCFCFVFFVGSVIPGTWGESYIDGSENVINSALDNTFGGTWYVLAGSTFAFLTSSIVNNFINYAIGRGFRKNPDGAAVYFLRTYISTALGQFTDNLVFALTVSHIFFGWGLLQCVTWALTGMLAELACEVVFSFFGYRICRRWKEKGVGEEYIKYKEAKAA